MESTIVFAESPATPSRMPSQSNGSPFGAGLCPTARWFVVKRFIADTTRNELRYSIGTAEGLGICLGSRLSYLRATSSTSAGA
ncbi:MAG: hypothetical protein NZT92_09485 [Abditibacteriales bacterium]|nr:hypothetical protein [Abditibacteriales bacterium]